MSKLNLLRQEFLKQFHHVAKYNRKPRFLDTEPLLLASYEYFRNRHIERVTTFTPEEHSSLQQNLLPVYYHLGLRWALSNLLDDMLDEDVFDYAKLRSATQFLIDDVSKFAPDGVIKRDCIEGMIARFDENKLQLNIGILEYTCGNYPRGPVPEHDGVPESHVWWKQLKESYSKFEY